MTRVFVHIDNLVLRGFRHEDRQAIAEGLSAELSRLYRDDPAAAQALASAATRGDFSRLRLGGVSLAPGTQPPQVGSQLGERVVHGIIKETKP